APRHFRVRRTVNAPSGSGLCRYGAPRHPRSFPTRRSSDLSVQHVEMRCHKSLIGVEVDRAVACSIMICIQFTARSTSTPIKDLRSEEHTSELQSRFDIVCRLLLEKNTLSAGEGENGPEYNT